MFPKEKDALEFDELGATRNMLQMNAAPVPDAERSPVETETTKEAVSTTSNGFSRFNVVIVNFLLVRILIPHVVLQPRQVGIGSAKMSKRTASNLKNVATILYQICGLLSPLPAVASSGKARRPSTLPSSQESAPQSAAPVGDEKNSMPSGNCFLSIDEIGSLLLPSTNFPAEESHVQQFAREQQVRATKALDIVVG